MLDAYTAEEPEHVHYDLPKAVVGAHFHSTVTGTCKGASWTPSRFAQVTSGTLPPGLQLSDGAIDGVPTQAGTYDAVISVLADVCRYPGSASLSFTLHVPITVR
jgi:hypothetical protein